MPTAGQNLSALQELSSLAEPSSCSQERAVTASQHKMNGSPPTRLWAHSGERQQQEDYDCLRETIFPIPNFIGHTQFSCHGTGGRFFFHALIDRSVPTSLEHSSPSPLLKGARNLQSKLRFLAVLQRYQSFTGSGVQKTTAAREALHGANNLDYLMIVYCVKLQYTHIFNHFSTHLIKQTLCKKTDTHSQHKFLLEILVQQLIVQLFLLLLYLT